MIYAHALYPMLQNRLAEAQQYTQDVEEQVWADANACMAKLLAERTAPKGNQPKTRYRDEY